MTRKDAPLFPGPTRKNRLKKSTFSSDSLFGTSSSNENRQLSVPRFNLSQNSPTTTQVIDLTLDDDDDTSSSRSRTPVPVPVPIPAHVAKKPRRMSPSPLGNEPSIAKVPQVKQGVEDEGEALWVDMHAPTSQEALAVHPKKIEDVRRWLSEALTGGSGGKLRRYRRILVLNGPSGCGKTATLRVLASELEAEVVEWHASSDEFALGGGDYNYESATTKLVGFLDRAGSYGSLSLSNTIATTSSTPTATDKTKNKNKVLLLEDFPSLSNSRVKQTLHSALVRFAETAPPPTSASSEAYPPLVIIISDAGLRSDESSYSYERSDVLDVRSVLPQALISSHYVTQIKFNPIAATFMRKALTNIISSHLSLPTPATSKSRAGSVPRETLDALVEASAGDIRSAIMAVQFACVVGGGELGSKNDGGKTVKGKKGKEKSGKSERDAAIKHMFAAVTRREQALALFHLLGRLFYNKRFGDPDDPGDAPPQKALSLPEHLVQFRRRVSKVDVDALHADSPVDTSLFALYVQHNFPQFYDNVEDCWGLANALSEADGGMGVLDDGPTTSSALAHHAFQHVARSALITLPSPVPRRSQVMRKPAWFAARAKEREAEGAVEDAKRWLNESAGGGWDRRSVVLDAGSVLNQMGKKGPPSAPMFCALRWDTTAGLGEALGEQEAVDVSAGVNAEDIDELEKRALRVGASKVEQKKEEKGYLSDDDIDDF